MATEAEFKVRNDFTLHKLEEGPKTEATATKDEMMGWLRDMLTIRRMEIACDQEYKMRNIRGFCHLYDGQEAVAVGTEAAITRKDDWVTSYRCHATAYIRGESVKGVLAELFGFKEGNVRGKGGSMHFYRPDDGFWGGHGIVGAQMPVGAGLGFANKYNAKEGEPMDISIAVCGDGAVNQGQVWESLNMASLWKLPVVYMVENNQYGMGTSSKRSSSNPDYYTHGNHVPGVRCDGMDVIAVRECMRFCKEWASSGKGPIFAEMLTYRYHGHSMSDPGITYRDRDEVNSMRSENDCIELLKKRIVDAGFADADELKAVEKDVRKHVNEQLAEAKKGTPPPEEDLYADIMIPSPKIIRTVEKQESIVN